MSTALELYRNLISAASYIKAYPNSNPDPPKGIPLRIGDVCFMDSSEGLRRGFSTTLPLNHPRNRPPYINAPNLHDFERFKIDQSGVSESTSLTSDIQTTVRSERDVSVGVGAQLPKVPVGFALVRSIQTSSSSTAALLFEPKPAKGLILQEDESFGRYIRANYADLVKNIRFVFSSKRSSSQIIFLSGVWRVARYAAIAHAGVSEEMFFGTQINMGSMVGAHASWGTWRNSRGGLHLPPGVWEKSNGKPDGNSYLKKAKNVVTDLFHSLIDNHPLYDDEEFPFTIMFSGYVAKEKTTLASKPDVQALLNTETYLRGIKWLCVFTGTYIEEAVNFVNGRGQRRDEEGEEDENDKNDDSGGGRLSKIKEKIKSLGESIKSSKTGTSSGSTDTGEEEQRAADVKEDKSNETDVLKLDPTEIALNYILAMCPAERAMVHTTQVLCMMDAFNADDEDGDLIEWLLKIRPQVSSYDDGTGFASFAVGVFQPKMPGINSPAHSDLQTAPEESFDFSLTEAFNFSTQRSLSGLTDDTSFVLSEPGKSLNKGLDDK